MSAFRDFNLNPKLLETLASLGFETPSPIQTGAIPILTEFKDDFIGLAPTGTGKTAAFSLPLLNRLAEQKTRGVQGLILCPTRELALQVSTQIDKLGKDLGIRSLPVYGGAGYRDQIRGLKSGASVVVGTPGRVLDHLRSGLLQLNNLQALILDEADEMISMGFQEDIETVLAQIPKEQARIWLFSATMSKQIRKIADNYLTSPKMIELNNREKVPTQLEQIYFVTREANKPDVVCKLIEDAPGFYGLIFCQTKALVTELTQELVDRGYKADSLHGDKTQEARERTLRSFRDRKLQILVCTDVASRGIDVQDVTHVVNYSLPRETENYIHRIGRTARSGKKGVAYSLVSPSQRGLVGRIEKITGIRMKEGVIPSSRLLRERKLGHLLNTFKEARFPLETVENVQAKWGEALEGFSREEIATRLLMMIAPELINPEAFTKDEEPAQFERSFQERRGGGRPRQGGGQSYDRHRPRRNSQDGERAPRRFDNEGERSERPARRFQNEGDRTERGPRRSFRDDAKTRYRTGSKPSGGQAGPGWKASKPEKSRSW